MTDKELKEFSAAIAKLHTKHGKSREAARKLLRTEGVIDDRNRLTKAYAPEPAAEE